MKLKIDNFDGHGPRDYSDAIDGLKAPEVIRKLNAPSELHFSLLSAGPDFLVPVVGARVTLGRTNGQDVFTGYISERPAYEYLGWSDRGPVYRYNILALSDEMLLDRQRLPNRSPFVERSAGDALRQLTEDLLPGAFDTGAIQDLDPMPSYACDPQKKWSQHAGAIGLLARASYRVMDGRVLFSPLGAVTHELDETSKTFSPEGLNLRCGDGLINDVTVIGRVEPSDTVKDYFVGDGKSQRFYLSQTPFGRSSRTLLDEEYKGTTLDATRWILSDPAHTISVKGGKLQVAGGTGADGLTHVQFAELVELGGAFTAQHGDVSFSAASDGIIGGLYPGAITKTGCLAGFRITKSGSQSAIQAIINGAQTGVAITTVAGHRYVLTTRFYSSQVFRVEQSFHSEAHPAGDGLGQDTIRADVRFVLEIHDIDPNNPGSLVAPSTVLYDGVISGAPAFATYVLANSSDLHCTLAFTRLLRAVGAEVRSALPDEGYRTRLVGSLADGAECLISGGTLEFFPQSVPAADELIEVRYRGTDRAQVRVTNPDSISSQRSGNDNGIRGVVLDVQSPAPRTAVDCENAALTILDDATGSAWSGTYKTWSDFLPDGADVFPGDAIHVSAPSRTADFRAIVREAHVVIKDIVGEHSEYTVNFADDASTPLAMAFASSSISDLSSVTVQTTDQIGSTFLADLTGAEISDATSTSVTIDAGITPPAGWGIEVRRSNQGWGPDNDRNLIGRFTTRTFLVPRLARVQDFFLRQYDPSARYSRYSAALHLDRPL